jgi:hypothetical protein
MGANATGPAKARVCGRVVIATNFGAPTCGKLLTHPDQFVRSSLWETRHKMNFGSLRQSKETASAIGSVSVDIAVPYFADGNTNTIVL